MKVETLGDGEPEYAVIGGIHGDEPCGKNAVERFLDSDFEVQKPVKMIIANEKAFENDDRFLDCDLNRSFPGDLESSLHEEQLAAQILEEVEDLKILDLHSTQSCKEIFAALSYFDLERLEMVKSTGAEKISFREKQNLNCLDEYATSITIECGLQKSEQAKENAYNVLLNFLAAEGVIDHAFEKSEPDVYRIFETVEKPGFNFLSENFRKVEKGEEYAKNGEKVLIVEKDFYPVLMSTNGYKHILGHKAEKIENF